jgi:hypothetical protein
MIAREPARAVRHAQAMHGPRNRVVAMAAAYLCIVVKRNIIFVGVIVLTVLQVGPTAATPVWLTLAIFTVNHFIEMHERQLHSDANMISSPHLAPVRVKG